MRKGIISTAVVTIAALALAASCTTRPTLSIKENTVNPGSTIVVEYKAPKGYKENAWVGIIPSEVEHGNETRNDRHDISYKYLKGSTAGSLTFTAPRKPGRYDFRMHDTDNDGMEVASVSFLVISKKGGTKDATVRSKRMEKVLGGFKTGDQVMVEWKGSWWPAEIVKTREGDRPFRIHYDGYSKSWDEWVGLNRIRNR